MDLVLGATELKKLAARNHGASKRRDVVVADIRDATQLLHTSFGGTPSKRPVVDDILDATQLLRISRMARRRA